MTSTEPTCTENNAQQPKTGDAVADVKATAAVTDKQLKTFAAPLKLRKFKTWDFTFQNQPLKPAPQFGVPLRRTKTSVSDKFNQTQKSLGKSLKAFGKRLVPKFLRKRKKDQIPEAASVSSVGTRYSWSDRSVPLPELLTDTPIPNLVLTPDVVQALRPHLPSMLQLASSWQLVHSLDFHGTSLLGLYLNSAEIGPCVLILRDTEGQIFGGYSSDSLGVKEYHFGNASCFVFKYSVSRNAQSSSGAAKPELQVFRATMKNSYFVLNHADCLSFGSSDGNSALFIAEDCLNGHTSTCATFDNAPLRDGDPRFKIAQLEVWSFIL